MRNQPGVGRGTTTVSNRSQKVRARRNEPRAKATASIGYRSSHATPVLVGLGITSFSMSASAVADVRDALDAVTLAECREMASDAPRSRIVAPGVITDRHDLAVFRRHIGACLPHAC